jgi:dihydroorotase (multifunctional complex type)
MTVDLTIRKCRILYKKRLVKSGLAIDEGKIVSIAKDTKLPKSDKKINCKGKIILPGLVDTHVHFREPGSERKEDWSTGSKAAAKGGITFVMEMPNTIPPTTSVVRLIEKKKLAKKSVVNFGLYAGIGEENIDEIENLSNHADAFKLYMAKSTGEFLIEDNDLIMKAFDNISKTNKVVCVHAENRKMNERFLKMYKNKDDPLAYVKSRPRESEILAINDAIGMAKQTRVKVHIVHVSTKGGLNLIKKSKKEVDVTCETCPHYLFMTQEDMKKKRAFAKMNPPLRTKQDQVALWKGITSGTIDSITSDHAPHTLEEKRQDVWLAPGGVPGVETTLPLMLNSINKRMIKLKKVVELMHDNPVKRFGLGNYGNIETGNDANLTVIDLKKKWKISREDLLTKCGWSPFEGWQVKGIPVMTIVNGKVVFD